LTPMDGKSSFKECPRCGLRNRVSAARCDFCDYEFQDSSEEWSDYVDVLEKLSESDEVQQVDEDLSRKIEATLVKTDREGVPTPAAALETGSTSVTREHEPPVDDEASDVTTFVDSMIDEGADEPDTSSVVEEAEKEASETAVPTLEPLEEIPLDLGLEQVGDELLGEGVLPATAVEVEAASDAELEPEAVEESITVGEFGAEGDVPEAEAQAAMEVAIEAELTPEVDVGEYETVEPVHAQEVVEEPPVVEGIPGEEAEPEELQVELSEEIPEEIPPAVTEEYPDEISAEPETGVTISEAVAAPGPSVLYMALMGVGALLYLVAIGGYALLSIDAALGWGLSVIGSILLLVGFRRFYDVLLPVSEARRRNTGI